jgi:nucleoside-diphosphate-sugar epimerase
MIVRMLADAAMTNLALAGALALRFAADVAFSAPSSSMPATQKFWDYTYAYTWNAPLLTALCLLVFAASGFYTYSRSYQGKYKALTITQAVVYSYLIFGCITYFSWDRFGWVELPRGALLLAFGTSLGLCLASRTWTALWEYVVQPERESRLRLRKDAGKDVLVIGGAGYIGSALLPKLLEDGYRVRVLDMFLYGTEPIANVAKHPRLELVKGDFRQVDKVVTAMKGMDAVIHLGAIVGDPACDLDEQVTIDINLSATQMIAQVAKASGISRFVFASTCSVYGACDDLLDEHSEVIPISLYGQTKLAAERGLQQLSDHLFMPTIVRFATIYGLSGRMRFDLVINLLTAKAKTEGVITVHGGDQWRPFVHVDDAALAVLKVLQAPLALVGNQTFNVGSNAQNYTISQIGEIIRDRVMGAELIQNAEARDKRNYRVSFDKIVRVLQFQPAWTVERGIDQVLEAIATGEVVDYRDAQHSNVKYLTENRAIEIIRVDDDWSRLLPALRKSSGEMDVVTEADAAAPALAAP